MAQRLQRLQDSPVGLLPSLINIIGLTEARNLVCLHACSGTDSGSLGRCKR